MTKRTSKGDISTPILINAAGPWAKSIGRLLGVDVPVEPERRHIFIASPPGGGSWDEPRNAGRVPTSKILVIDFESTFYFHREGGGVLFGMGDPDERPGFDTTVRWDFLPKVIEVAMQRLPALSDAAVSHAWAGLYEMTPDHNPIIAPTSDVDGFYSGPTARSRAEARSRPLRDGHNFRHNGRNERNRRAASPA